MSRKGYPKEFRDAAIQRVRDGEAIARVSEDVGISYTTLHGWCNKAGVPMRQYRCFVPDYGDGEESERQSADAYLRCDSAGGRR